MSAVAQTVVDELVGAESSANRQKRVEARTKELELQGFAHGKARFQAEQEIVYGKPALLPADVRAAVASGADKVDATGPSATGAGEKKGSFLDKLRTPLGPLPLWGWTAAGLGVVVGGYLLLKRRKG